jgi:hypothetical protein
METARNQTRSAALAARMAGQSCSLAGAVESHPYHVTQMIEAKSISEVCFDHACSLQLSLYRRHQPPN